MVYRADRIRVDASGVTIKGLRHDLKSSFVRIADIEHICEVKGREVDGYPPAIDMGPYAEDGSTIRGTSSRFMSG